jgi:Protein of unknown function (DUF669)
MTTKLNEAFDVENEEGGGQFDVLPAGKYNADLMQVEVVTLKSGKGQAVKMNWCIYDGDYEGRWLFDQVIIQHESAEAQKFGKRKFKDVCVACGITAPISDVSVLLHKRCALDVGIEKDKTGEYSDKNRIRRVMPYASPLNGKENIVRQASTTPPSGKAEKVQFSDEVPF